MISGSDIRFVEQELAKIKEFRLVQKARLNQLGWADQIPKGLAAHLGRERKRNSRFYKVVRELLREHKGSRQKL